MHDDTAAASACASAAAVAAFASAPASANAYAVGKRIGLYKPGQMLRSVHPPRKEWSRPTPPKSPLQARNLLDTCENQTKDILPGTVGNNNVEMILPRVGSAYVWTILVAPGPKDSPPTGCCNLRRSE